MPNIEIKVQLSTLNFRNEAIVVTDANGKIIETWTHHDFPRTFSQLYKQYLNCNLNSTYPNKKKGVRYTVVMVISHPIFFLKNALHAKKLVLSLSKENIVLPLTFSVKDDARKFWISREAVKNGMRASTLASHLEIDLVNLTKAYKGWVWGIGITKGRDEVSRFKSHELEFIVSEPWESSTSQVLFTEEKSHVKFGVKKFNNGRIIHGKYLVKDHEFFPVDFRQFQPTRYSVSDAVVNYETKEVAFLSPISSTQKVSSAIFVGSHSNYFHFVYECLTRLIYLQQIPDAPKKIIVSADLPGTLVDLLEKFFDLQCIFAGYYQEIIVEDLWLGYTVEQPGMMKIDGRMETFKSIRNQIRKSLERDDSITPNLNIFVRRPFKSTRPLQNRSLLIAIAILNGFKVISPEKLDITQQIMVFENANRIIGEEGAALTNLLFVNENTKVLELQEPIMHSKNLFRDYSMIKPDNYFLAIGDPWKFGESGFSRDGFIINPFRVLKWIWQTKKNAL